MDYSSKWAESNAGLIKEVKQRWSPRAFSDKPVEEDKLRALFEAARWAPSSSNVQPWRFIIARKGEAHYQKLFEALVEGNQKWAHRAPVLCATVARKTRTASDGSEKPNKHAWHDIGLAMGNLLAQATHMGLFLHQMGGFSPDKEAENFNLDTAMFEAVTCFVVGYHDETAVDELSEGQAESERAPRKRKELDELLHGARFGQAPDWL